MIAFADSFASPENEETPLYKKIAEKFAEYHCQSSVTCALISSSSGEILVNNKPFNQDELHHLDLPKMKAKGSFKIRCEGEEVVVTFTSDQLGTIERKMHVGSDHIAVYRGDRFYLAPVILQFEIKQDGNLYLQDRQIGENESIKLGVGELKALKLKDVWSMSFLHPDDTLGPESYAHCLTPLEHPGKYELTYCYGRLMTTSYAKIEYNKNGYYINGVKVKLDQQLPFHVNENGLLKVEKMEGALFVSYSDSRLADTQKICQIGQYGVYNISYNSGDGIQFVY